MYQVWVAPVPTSMSKLSGLCDGTVRSYMQMRQWMLLPSGKVCCILDQTFVCNIERSPAYIDSSTIFPLHVLNKNVIISFLKKKSTSFLLLE